MAQHPGLSHWLRLLWGQAPALHFDAEAPFIASGGVHLPPQRVWQQHSAAAGHAAAHLAYSPPRFDGTGLAPIARALLGLLEDARAEALAGRDLPGLWRLWRPLHVATPDDGSGFEALMGRLARALADPAYVDPHPWVGKGRALFFLDAAQDVVALRTPAELRTAAMRLGHDIGQMRLQFNARLYRPTPAYRDDHRWMWAADTQTAVQPPVPQTGASTEEPDDDAPATSTRHPEWDRLIGRLRPQWSTVIEQVAPPGPAAPAFEAASQELGHRLRVPLRTLLQPLAPHRRSRDGEVFDLDALVDWRLAQRLRLPCDARVHRSRPRQGARPAVWLLVDQSASTAATHAASGQSVLQLAVRSAAALAHALHAMGAACAISGFHSNGRHAVRLQTVQRLDRHADAAMAARLSALRPAGSTRLGAALRHAGAVLAARPGGPHWVLLLSDGEPHDIDVHDRAYLVDDARQAVRSAARRAVRMACITVGTGDEASARSIFGRRAICTLAAIDTLPQALRRLRG